MYVLVVFAPRLQQMHTHRTHRYTRMFLHSTQQVDQMISMIRWFLLLLLLRFDYCVELSFWHLSQMRLRYQTVRTLGELYLQCGNQNGIHWRHTDKGISITSLTSSIDFSLHKLYAHRDDRSQQYSAFICNSVYSHNVSITPCIHRSFYCLLLLFICGEHCSEAVKKMLKWKKKTKNTS